MPLAPVALLRAVWSAPQHIPSANGLRTKRIRGWMHRGPRMRSTAELRAMASSYPILNWRAPGQFIKFQGRWFATGQTGTGPVREEALRPEQADAKLAPSSELCTPVNADPQPSEMRRSWHELTGQKNHGGSVHRVRVRAEGRRRKAGTLVRYEDRKRQARWAEDKREAGVILEILSTFEDVHMRTLRCMTPTRVNMAQQNVVESRVRATSEVLTRVDPGAQRRAAYLVPVRFRSPSITCKVASAYAVPHSEHESIIIPSVDLDIVSRRRYSDDGGVGGLLRAIRARGMPAGILGYISGGPTSARGGETIPARAQKLYVELTQFGELIDHQDKSAEENKEVHRLDASALRPNVTLMPGNCHR
ncbi:hypothetical protein PENSPDRAFT_732551 [Peniophora sp. CONT]|nr:hypothetical protein PENSPDRAFT_732551 [Peniophora sp. CONT]